jgi:hypothetical protein
MESSRIKFKTDKDGIYCPERLSGSREDFKKLGIEVLGEESKDSAMWEFEGVNVKIPDVEFDAFLYFDDDDHNHNEWIGDVSLEFAGFGYVEKDDFEIISGYNPFNGDRK